MEIPDSSHSESAVSNELFETTGFTRDRYDSIDDNDDNDDDGYDINTFFDNDDYNNNDNIFNLSSLAVCRKSVFLFLSVLAQKSQHNLTLSYLY